MSVTRKGQDRFDSLGLTISISFMLAYRGNCFPLSAAIPPLPSRPIVKAAAPKPTTPAASATPNNCPRCPPSDPGPPSDRGVVVVVVVVVAHLAPPTILDVDAIEYRGQGRRRTTALPHDEGPEAIAALKITFSPMQATKRCSRQAPLSTRPVIGEKPCEMQGDLTAVYVDLQEINFPIWLFMPLQFVVKR